MEFWKKDRKKNPNLPDTIGIWAGGVILLIGLIILIFSGELALKEELEPNPSQSQQSLTLDEYYGTIEAQGTPFSVG